MPVRDGRHHPRPADPGRTADVLLYVLYRPLMFALWVLVLWGTLLILGVLWQVVADGGAATLRRLRPPPAPDVWYWVNLGTMPLAALVWGTLLVGWSLRSRGEGS